MKKPHSFILKLLLLGIAFLISFSALTHPISMSSAIVDATEEGLVVEMRVLVEDLVLFYDLKPGKDQKLAAEDLRIKADEHTQFLLKHFSIRDTAGSGLDGEVTRIDKSQIAEEGIHPADLMTYAIIYNFFYPTSAPSNFYTFSQNFPDAKAGLPAVMDIIVLQNAQMVEEPTKITPTSPYTIELDWVNPKPLPKNWRERKALREEKRKAMLGITSYTAVYSYLYITDTEVRHEILIPLLTLESWIKLDRTDPDWLEIAEQKAAEKRVFEFFAEHNQVTIDGVGVQPVLDRLSFFGVSFKDFARMTEPRRVSSHTARVGLILTYPTKQSPKAVSMTWDLFNDTVPFLRSFVYPFDESVQQFFFVQDEATYNWAGASDYTPPILNGIAAPETPKSKIPLLPLVAMVFAIVFLLSATKAPKGQRSPQYLIAGGILIAGLIGWNGLVWETSAFSSAPPPEQKEAAAVFESLLGNVYRAFDYRDEEAIYDALANSVGGPYLDSVYLEIFNGLQMTEQGGARSRVREVRIQKATPVSLAPNSYGVDCQWTIEGSVEHWGHVHTRKNLFAGRFAVQVTDGHWRITGLDLSNQERLQFETSLRDFN